jgi:glycosyltransferase involved in cell wall biosynthesis
VNLAPWEAKRGCAGARLRPCEMRVLIVAFAFPPSNVVGAIRVGKLARYLQLHGHDLRVLTTDIGGDRSLPLEIPKEQVVYTDYRQREYWLDLILRPFRSPGAAALDQGGPASRVDHRALGRSSREWLQRQYHGLMNIPDLRSDWIKTAMPMGRRLIEEWRPDIIFASAPPFTGLIVAGRLSRAFDIPWVADFRDLWVDNPYYSEPAWRRLIDAAIERLTLRNAELLVTVSPIWAEQLRRRHGKLTKVVYNGYAAEDFPQSALQADPGEMLIIRYTGSIYRGFRDPSALFAAIALLPDTLRNRVTVEFYGDSSDEILALAAQQRVRDRVAAWPPVPYARALDLQMNSDILLLLQWSDARDEGNLPGKTFEYLYARRPILFIGYERGVAAQLIRERRAGLVANNPEPIRDQLRVWIGDKRAGRLKRLDPSVSLGLSRDEQFLKLERVFANMLNERRPGPRREQSGARGGPG